MDNKYLSKTIKAKTSGFFRLSLIIFVVSFSFLIITTILLISQYQQIENDFINNTNTHLVEVSSFSPKEMRGAVDLLNFEDIEKIHSIVDNQDKDSIIFCEYAINFGISDSNNNVFFIRSYDDSAASVLGEIDQDEALCNHEMTKDLVSLHIPMITVSDAGFSSDLATERTFTFVPTDTNMSPVSYIQLHSDTVYVNYATFQSIIEDMFGINWNEFSTRYANGENFGINLINRIFVYVEDLSNSRAVATALSKSDYNVVYTLGAFDDMGASIDTSIWVFLILGMTVLLVTTVNVVMSYRNYLLTSQKDIGILQFYGYSTRRIFLIYKKIINDTFWGIFAIGFILTIGLAPILLDNNKIPFLLLLLACQAAFLMLLQFVIGNMLKKICSTNTLTLIKNSKQAE